MGRSGRLGLVVVVAQPQTGPGVQPALFLVAVVGLLQKGPVVLPALLDAVVRMQTGRSAHLVVAPGEAQRQTGPGVQAAGLAAAVVPEVVQRQTDRVDQGVAPPPAVPGEAQKQMDRNAQLVVAPGEA